MGAGAAVSSDAVDAGPGGRAGGGVSEGCVSDKGSALRADGGGALDAAASVAGGSGSGALLVARSKVMLRTGSGALSW